MKIDPGRTLLSLVMVTIGVLHFTHTASFASIVPDYLPYPEALVLISGMFELALGVALSIERTRTIAAYGLVALFIAVFPANINMALHPDRPIAGVSVQPSALALYLRLPLQLFLIGWALRYTKKPAPSAGEPERLGVA